MPGVCLTDLKKPQKGAVSEIVGPHSRYALPSSWAGFLVKPLLPRIRLIKHETGESEQKRDTGDSCKQRSHGSQPRPRTLIDDDDASGIGRSSGNPPCHAAGEGGAGPKTFVALMTPWMSTCTSKES